jgi:DNA-binding MarR family transcriptional regulator
MRTSATLARELVDLTALVKHIVRQVFTATDGRASPTLTQYRILFKIRDGICHVGTLSDAFGISQPATSIMVATMVRQGLLTRIPHATDRRRIDLHLTARARADLETNYNRALANVETTLASLPTVGQKAALRHIRALARALTRGSARGEPHNERRVTRRREPPAQPGRGR